MKKKYKAVIFDLDGTLLDTIDDIAISANTVLKRHGFPIHKTREYKLFVGEGMETLVYKILPREKRSRSFIKKIIKEIRLEYSKNWNKNTKIYSGILDLLNFLQLKKIKMSVLSNKPDNFTKLMVKHFFPNIKFSFVLGTRTGVPKKPDPTVSLQIAKKLNIKPQDIVYLGDTNTDMKTAKNSGMFAVGALWGFRTKSELIKNGAKLLIKKPMELFKKCFL